MKYLNTPSSDDIKRELDREKYKKRYNRTLRSTVVVLITAAALAVLVATLWLPVLQIYGSSMVPTLQEGEIVVSVKERDFQQGDVIAFYFNNKVLVRRVAAVGNEQITVDVFGTVSVNGNEMEESYIEHKTYGQCDIDFPFTVPSNTYFVLGDNREVAMDSRLEEIGTVAEDRIIGKIVFSIYPLRIVK